MHEHSFKTLLEQQLPNLTTFGFDQIDQFFRAAYSMYFRSWPIVIVRMFFMSCLRKPLDMKRAWYTEFW